MLQQVFNYKPVEHDYRIWLVLNPAGWLIPMFAVAVHAMVFAMPEYSLTKADGVKPAWTSVAASAQAPQ